MHRLAVAASNERTVMHVTNARIVAETLREATDATPPEQVSQACRVARVAFMGGGAATPTPHDKPKNTQPTAPSPPPPPRAPPPPSPLTCNTATPRNKPTGLLAAGVEGDRGPDQHDERPVGARGCGRDHRRRDRVAHLHGADRRLTAVRPGRGQVLLVGLVQGGAQGKSERMHGRAARCLLGVVQADLAPRGRPRTKTKNQRPLTRPPPPARPPTQHHNNKPTGHQRQSRHQDRRHAYAQGRAHRRQDRL
jgi:hypothetical protein